MSEISKAFMAAYKRRTFLWQMLVLPPIFLLSMKIAGYFFTTIKSFVLAVVVIALVVITRNIVISSPMSLERKIQKAFYYPEQYKAFVTTIDDELHNSNTRNKYLSDEKIYLCLSVTWFVLITPNGSLICNQSNISKITSVFRETNSRHYLKIVLSDGHSRLFPYPELEEMLVEWNKIKRGESET